MRHHTLTPDFGGPRTGPERVLVGIDFGEPSLAAARWVADHLARDAQIVLVHVIPVPSGPPFLLDHLRAPGPLFEQVTPPLWGGLHGLAGVLGAGRVRVELRAGDPAEELAAAAAAAGADLVCVGRPRERGDTARHGRNTVNRLLRRLDVPLLQPAGVLNTPPSQILAAVDGGDASDAVLSKAWSLAARLEARLTSLHVLDDVVGHYARTALEACHSLPDIGARPETRTHPGEVDEALRSVTAGWMRSALGRIGARSERCDIRVGEGDPGADILATVHQQAVDLIVVGRTGRDAVGTSEVGSTTRLLLRVAPCPIMVVPALPVRTGPSGPERERARRVLHRSRASWAPLAGGSGDLPPAARGKEVA